MVDFQWLPSNYAMVIGSGYWLKNLLGILPMLLFLSVFALLLYHVLIILHSIHLAYDPLLQSLRRLRAPIEQQTVSLDYRPKWCCIWNCYNWLTLYGRPHSTFKWMLIICFAVLWSLFVLLVLLDWSKGSDSSLFLLLLFYFLEWPAIIVSSTLGICFTVSGVALVRRLNQLSAIVEREVQTGSIDALGAVFRAGSNFERSSSVFISNGQQNISGVSGDFLNEWEYCIQGVDDDEGYSKEGQVAQSLSDGRHQSRGSDKDDHSAARYDSVEQGLQSTCETLNSRESSSFPFRNSPYLGSPGMGSAQRLHLQNLQAPLSRSASNDFAGARRNIHSSISSHLSWASPLDAGSDTSLPAMQDDIFDRIATIDTVIQGARRILFVVLSCVVAFLWRSCCIAVLTFRFQNKWPKGMMFFYLLFAEVVPISIFVTLYLLPGLHAICWSREHLRPSVVESMIAPLPHVASNPHSMARRSTEGSSFSPCSSPSLRPNEARSSNSSNSACLPRTF